MARNVGLWYVIDLTMNNKITIRVSFLRVLAVCGFAGELDLLCQDI